MTPQYLQRHNKLIIKCDWGRAPSQVFFIYIKPDLDPFHIQRVTSVSFSEKFFQLKRFAQDGISFSDKVWGEYF